MLDDLIYHGFFKVLTFETMYSEMDRVNFVEDSL